MNWLVLIFCIVASADPSSLVTGHYEIRGYSKKSQSGNERVEIKAEMAKGFSFGGFEEIEKPEIIIKNSKSILTLASDHGLSKDDEIILEGHVTAEWKFKQKKILAIKSSALHFQLTDYTLRSPSAEVWVKNKTHQNLSIHVDLKNRKLDSPEKKLNISF
jgi:hypothetical protein